MPRVQAREVAGILGVTRRTVLNLANKGALPSAAKIGSVWTFDEARIRQYLDDQEAIAAAGKWQRGTSTSAAKSGGCEPPCGAVRSEKAFERGISRLLAVSGTPGSKNSRPPHGGANVR